MAAPTDPITYPSQISDYDFTLTYLMFPGTTFGPFSYANRLYVVNAVYNVATPTYVTVHRSIDNGLTWQECDAGNRKALSPTAQDGNAAIGISIDGSDIIVGINPAMEVHRFSMYASAWEAVLASSGPTVNDPHTATWLTKIARLFPARRSDDSLIVQYQTDSDAFSAPPFTFYFPRFRYAVYDGAWNDFSVTGYGPSDLKNEVAAGACLNLDNDRYHMFFLLPDPDTGFPYLKHASVASDGTLDTIVDVAASIEIANSGSNIPSCVVSQPICANGVVYIAFVGNDSKVYCAYATSGESPAFTVEEVPGLESDTNNKDYFPNTSTPGNILSLAFGGLMMGTLFSANPDDASSNDGFRAFYLPIELLENDPDTLYLFTRVGGSSDWGSTNYVYSRRTAANTWTNPVEVYNPNHMNSIWGTRVLCACSEPTPPSPPASGDVVVTY